MYHLSRSQQPLFSKILGSILSDFDYNQSLLMWVSSAILNLKSYVLNHWFARTKAWCRVFLLPSLADYNNSRLESDSGKIICFASSRHYASNAGVCYNKPFGEDIDTIVKNIVVVPSGCVKTIRNVLVKHIWIQRFEKWWSELWIGVEKKRYQSAGGGEEKSNCRFKRIVKVVCFKTSSRIHALLESCSREDYQTINRSLVLQHVLKTSACA